MTYVISYDNFVDMAKESKKVRVLFTIDDDIYRKLQRLRRELKLPVRAYSDVVNQSLGSLIMFLEAARTLKGKSKAEQSAEFYNIMSKLMGEMASKQMLL